MTNDEKEVQRMYFEQVVDEAFIDPSEEVEYPPVALSLGTYTYNTKKGVKEIMLIAQDLTYYGLDIYKKRETFFHIVLFFFLFFPDIFDFPIYRKIKSKEIEVRGFLSEEYNYFDAHLLELSIPTRNDRGKYR